ncbi:Gamma-glutamylputrescine oxidoreductase [Roseovarius sp. THAF8]|uniref:NAD(P)/FAD-dependent oxidoreductase n=1 Tax=Roseovarius sp. THAF8 TaxID=2587846 RepID=UPI001267CEAB|nr:FAD-binding oxidoreductase [Roseovarius sp. THAF8]QFT96439.1 Gamma-glutamylputrescine oxidoreductase [Roseovarius sp. THAF8]
MTEWTGEAAPGRPWWWEAVEPEATEDGLPDHCDVLVIGAGYTGLSAAIAAHDSGARVVVAEAGVPGEGASSRNGGMVGAHPRLSWDKMAAAFGADVADDLLAEAAPALDWAKTFIEHEKIQCDFEVTGRVQLAYTRSQFDGQKRLADKVREKSRVEVELVERSDLGREIDTGLYHGGLLFPQHGALHPAKYHRGMLEAVRRRGVPVVSHARVEAMTREGTRLVAQTAKGPIRSEKVVLATNGYTTRPFQWHLRRVFPLPSFIIATEELPENLIGHLAPGRRMMVETRARHSYFRISPDGKRVLFGGRAAMRDVPLHIAAQRQRQTMVEVWPELAEAKLSHVWSGYTGFSFAQMPHVGQHDSVCFAMGFSGSGTVMAPYLGAKAGWLAVGDARAETAYARTRLPRHVLHPFDRPHFLKAADLVFRHWVDRAEAWQARRS